MIPCQFPGHDHVPAADSATGYQLPFCAPHNDALPIRLQRPMHEVAEASIYELEQHDRARASIDAGVKFLQKLPKKVRGICVRCGCTQEYGCDGGCHWVDRGQTRAEAEGVTPEQQATDAQARADGLLASSWRPTTFKRYSSNGVCRLYSLIEGEWMLVAKRLGTGPWCGVPNARARRKALTELRGR